jgi:hypothetical protein
MHQMHLDEEQIQRTLHDEGGAATPAIQQHLSTCAECRSTLSEAQREEEWVLERLGSVDHAMPQVTARSVMLHSTGTRPAWARLAAGVFLALGLAGVAYAAPGSPLRAAIRGLMSLVQAPSVQTTTKPAPPETGRPQEGIAVEPGARLTIDFSSSTTADTAVISLTDGVEVVTRALGGAATFSSDAEHLVIRNSGGAATFEMLVPRAAPWVSIRYGIHQIWLKSHSRIQSEVTPDRAGRYVFPLSQKSGSPAP